MLAGSGAVHSADAWAEKEMEAMEASVLSNAGLGKMTVFIVIPSSPIKLHFLRLYRKDPWIQRMETHLKQA